MANYASSIRRIRRSEKSRVRNQQYRSRMKTAIKGVLASENKEDAMSRLKTTVSLLDKMAIKRIIHKNKASNQKSRLSLFVNNM